MPLHPVAFSSISSRTILPSPQSQQPTSIVATISAICRPRCLIPLMPLLSSTSTAVAVVVLFLYQPRCCLPRLCHQSCEQDRLGRASPAVSPPLHHCHRRAPPLCLIVTGSDLRPIVPSRPSSALMLLPQPLLVDCLTAAPSSSPTIFYSNIAQRDPFIRCRCSAAPTPSSSAVHPNSINSPLCCPTIAYAPFFLLCVPRVEPPHSHACTLLLSQAYMADEINYCQTFTVVDNITVSFLQVHWHLFKICILHRSLILWGHDSLMIVRSNRIFELDSSRIVCSFSTRLISSSKSRHQIFTAVDNTTASFSTRLTSPSKSTVVRFSMVDNTTASFIQIYYHWFKIGVLSSRSASLQELDLAGV
ncbi:hypothetical protein BHE74_00046526 [Ensete ventricosum]|nr:hypothetical protein BHE74_00046526 [Ensete ventricosum]